MYDPNHNAPPFNPVPPVVWAMVAVLALIEAAFQAGAQGLIGGPGAIGWRVEAIRSFGFSAAIWDWMVENRQAPVEFLYRFVSYGLVHGGFSHTLFACVMLLALGNFTARVFSPWALMAVVLASLIAGAVAFGMVEEGAVPLYGAFPAVYGLLGLYTWCLWTMAERLGRNPYAAFQLIGVLIAIRVLFGVIDGRWLGLFAEVAGFAAGFLLAAPAAPGGLQALRARLRGR